jgi:hypothetical protein
MSQGSRTNVFCHLPMVMMVLSQMVFIYGCHEDDILFEIPPSGTNPEIIQVIDSIEFKFCLLDEEGSPSIIFPEGENFSFYFSMKNMRNKSLPFYDYSFFESDDFFEVKKGNQSLGQPYVFLGDRGTKELRYLLSKMPSGSHFPYVLSVPWHNSGTENWEMGYCRFKSAGKSLLPKGKYVTKFTHSFSFRMPGKEPVLKPQKLTFLINFEVR